MIFSRGDNGAKENMGCGERMLGGHAPAASESRKTSSSPAAHMVWKLQQPNIYHNIITKNEKKIFLESEYVKIWRHHRDSHLTFSSTEPLKCAPYWNRFGHARQHLLPSKLLRTVFKGLWGARCEVW